MGAFIKKVFYTLVTGLAIIAIAGLVYLIIPKYQIHSVWVNIAGDDYIVVTNINTITGDVIVYPEKVFISIFDKFR